jgi:hypothetical protein
MLNVIYGKRRNHVKHIKYGLFKITKNHCKTGLIFPAIDLKAASYIFPQDAGKNMYAHRLLVSSDMKKQ